MNISVTNNNDDNDIAYDEILHNDIVYVAIVPLSKRNVRNVVFHY